MACCAQHAPGDVQLLLRMQQLNSTKGCTKPHQPHKELPIQANTEGGKKKKKKNTAIRQNAGSTQRLSQQEAERFR